MRAGLGKRSGVIVPLGSGLGLRQGEILAISLDDIDRGACGGDRAAAQDGQRRSDVRAAQGWQDTDGPGGGELLTLLDEYCEMFEPGEMKLPWRVPDGSRSRLG